MVRDPLWQQIKSGFQKQLDFNSFERCAQDLLGKIYPGLVPVVGGSDSGMDGSLPSSDGTFPLICTTGDDVLGNFRDSISNHLKKRGGPARCVLATSQALTPQRRDNIFDEAKKLGITIHQIHEQEDFIGRLYRHSAWRLELLGITGEPPALSVFPPYLRQVEATLLIGREADLSWLRETQGDLLIVGQPGSGKTHLHQHMTIEDDVLFAVSEDETQLANAIRAQQPRIIVVDDAHIRPEWIDRLRRLRAEIGADYRIHANCWPTSADLVRNRLCVSQLQVRQFQPIPRKIMAELIRALGIWGPDYLLFLLLEQSAGCPGLCTVLVDACKRGELDRIWTGDALADRLLVIGALLRDEIDRELLARFALGGDTGARIDAVAASMEMKRFELRDRITSLGVGGIFTEASEGDRLVVNPEPLRSVLIRDVFFKGPVSPNLEQSLADCADAASVTHALISTKQRKVAVPVSLIRKRVFEVNGRQLWEHYAFLDDFAANDILDNRPAMICHAGAGLLRHAPERTIQALIRSDESGDVSSGDTHHPHRLITEWISDWDHEDDTSVRRQMVLTTLEHANAGGTPFTATTVLKYVRVVMDPQIHGMKPSPSDRHAIIYRHGIHSGPSIRQIAGLWPRVVALLPREMLPGWQTFIAAIHDWAWPGRGDGNVASEISAFMKESARTFISDLLAVPQCGRSLRKALRWIDRNAKLGIGIPRDGFFDLVLAERDHSQGWEQRHTERMVELEELASHLVGLGCAESTKALGELEQEVIAFGDIRIGWDRISLYTLIATKAKNTHEWMAALLDRRVPAKLINPFIKAVRRTSPDLLGSTFQKLVNDQCYGEMARHVILLDPLTPIELVDTVIASLEPLGENDAYRFYYKDIPIDRMLKLMKHPNAEIRIASALGEWEYNTDHRIRSELYGVWEESILSSEPRRGTELTMLFTARADLGQKWAGRRIAAGGHGIWRFDQQIIMIAENLSRDQRDELAALMNSYDRFDDGLFDVLVGTDDDSFRRWYTSVPDESTKMLPLRRQPSDLWRARAVIAMDAGMEPAKIAGLIGHWNKGWSGPQSLHFQGYLDAYNKLLLDPDDRFRLIAERGRAWAEQRMEEARRREFLESI